MADRAVIIVAVLLAEHLDGCLVVHTAEHGPRYSWPIGSDALGPIRDVAPEQLQGATLTLDETGEARVVDVAGLRPCAT